MDSPVALRAPSERLVFLVVVASALIYLAFAWSHDSLTAWVGAHPAGSRVLFLEFPPWPWIALVLFALAPGELWVERTDRRGQTRYMAWMMALGALLLAGSLGDDRWMATPNHFTFKRDFVLNNHWTPQAVTAIGIIGLIFCLLALFYWLAEVRGYRMTWLVTFGQTALVLYFVHQLIVLALVNQALHLRFNNWWTYGVANLVLMILLLGLGRAWLELKRLYRARLPTLGLFRRV